MANPALMVLPLNGSLQGRDRAGVFSAVGAGAVRYRPATGARINYAVNGGCEDTANMFGTWSPYGVDVFEFTDAFAASGSHSLHVQMDGTVAYSGLRHIAGASMLKPLAGRQVWCTFKIRGSGTIKFVQLNSFNSAFDTFEQDLQSVVPVPSDWTEMVFGPVTILPDPGWLAIEWLNDASVDGSGAYDLYVDDVMFTTEDPTGWAYFDGTDSGVLVNPVTGVLGSLGSVPAVSRVTGWLEEGATNLVANPSAEIDSTYWGEAAVSTVLTRDAAVARVGGASVRSECPGSVIEGVYASFSALSLSTDAHTLIGSIDAMGDGEVYCYVAVFYTDASDDYGVGTIVSLTEDWQRITTPPIVSDAGKTILNAIVVVQTYAVPQVVTYWCDGAQIQESSYATSYIDGSLGTGHAWTGTAHASASTRTAATITMDEAGRIDPVSGSLAFRFVRDIDTGAAEPILDVGEGTSGKDRLRIRINSSDKLEVSWQSNGASETTLASTQSITVGTAYWVYVAWSGTSVWVGIDANALASGTRNAPQNNWGTTDLVVGTTAGSAAFGSFAIYDQPLEAGYRQMVRDAMAAGSELWSLLDAEGSLYGVMDLDQVLSGELMALSAGG